MLLGAQLFLGMRSVHADDAIPMSVADLTRHADLIVLGKVEGKEIKRDAQQRIFTEVRLAVQEVWKGDPKKPLLTVVHGGGILGGQKAAVTGQVSYEPGELVVGFYVWNERGEAVTLSMSQGKFHVTQNPDGDTEVANPFLGRPARETTAAAASQALPKLTLESLKSQVKENR